MVRILFFNRSNERDLLLKATTTKTVTIPAFTDKNGRFVAAHQKLVHFDPNKSVADVVSGNGSHSQKKAHAKLNKYPGFKDLHEMDQYHHILSSGTNVQKKASASAALSGWKDSLLAGNKPSKSQSEAFAALQEKNPQAAYAKQEEVVSAIGIGKFAELASSFIAAKEPEPVGFGDGSHLTGIVAKVKEKQAKFGATVTDVTPAGYGPDEPMPTGDKAGVADLQAAYEAKKPAPDQFPTFADHDKADEWAQEAPIEGSHFTTDVNAVTMIHATSKDGAAGIAATGFKLSNNSMYGKGVYFSSQDLSQSGYGETSLFAQLKPHKQLVLDNDTDVPAAFSKLTGLSAGQLGSDKGVQAMLDAGVGSMRFKMDDSDYTVVFDPALIEAKPAAGGEAQDDPASPFPNFHQSEAEAAVATAKLAEIAAGHGGHYPGIAYKKLSGSPSWLDDSPIGKLSDVVKLAKELQQAANASSAVSMWKQAALAGKNPTPAQWTAFGAIPDDKKSAMMDAVKAAHGNWDHLKHPDAPKSKAEKVGDGLQSAFDKTYGHQPKVILPVGPKNGDTKTGADGLMLTFKDGRWHKPAAAKTDSVSTVLSGSASEPITDYDAGSPAKMYLVKEEDFASSAIGVVGQEMVDHVMASAKKWLAANPGNEDEVNHALDALGYEQLFADKYSLTPDKKEIVDTLAVNAVHGGIAGLQAVMDGNPAGSETHEYAKQKLAEVTAGNAPVSVPEVEPSFSTYHHTTDGHNKSWSVAVDGNKMITKHGKIGAKQSSTVKEFASHEAAVNAAHKLMDQKKAKGYSLFDDSGDSPANSAAVTPATVGKSWEFQANDGTLSGAPSISFSDDHDYTHYVTWSAVDKMFQAGAIDADGNPSHHEDYVDAAEAMAYLSDFLPPDKMPNAADLKKLINAAAQVAGGKPVKPTVSGTWFSVVSGIEAAIDSGNLQHVLDIVALTNGLDAPQAKATNDYAVAAMHFLKGASAGPKEGDTKQGADGTLVFKDGRWHKQGVTIEIPDFSDTNSPKWAKVYADAAQSLLGAYQAGSKLSAFVTNRKVGNLAGGVSVTINGYKLKCAPSSTNQRHIKMLAFVNQLQALQGKKIKAVVSQAKKAPADAAPSVTPTVAIQKAKNPGAALMTGWTKTGEQKGSNPGGQFTDKAGQKWYCKFPSDPDVAKNEFLAAKLYQMLGVAVPNLKLVEKDGKLGIASKWVDGLSVGTADQLAKAKGAHEAFAIDAWIGNWDVVGLSNDNLMIGKDGAVRVDVGGSLLYRAQGGAKGAAFGNEVMELQTLLDAGMNDKSAAVFGGVTKDGMAWGAGQLAKLKPSQISALCRKVGPGDSALQDALAQKLIARRVDILQKLGIEDPWNKPPMDESNLPVNPADMPKPHDFANFNGPGKGLSSSAKLNEQNTKDDVALIAFAAQGNLTALKAYHYDAINKDTGEFIGKKPITEHPSKWVKEHWAYLVETLDMIAHPSVQGLDMPPISGGGSSDEVSEMVGFVQPGERVATISAEKRLGFWMKLSAIDSDTLADLVPKVHSNFTAAMRSASISNWWPKVSSAVKGYVSAVQASGWVNHVFSNGDKDVSVSGHSGGVQGLAAKVYADAIESPEGMEIYRWMHMPHAMMQQLLAEKPGLVFQNTDSMCASYNPAWANSSHFGSDCLMKIRYAKGAKAIHSFASGGFKSENEITTLMGARFVLLSSKQGNAANGSGIEIEVLMLPPHEGYVSELQSQAVLGKSMILFFVKEAA